MSRIANIGSRVLSLALLLLVGLGAAAPEARAQEAPVQVMQILASNRPGEGSADALGKLKAQFAKYKYKSYTVLDRTTRRLADGRPTTFPLDGGATLSVTIEARSSERVKLRIVVTESGGTETLNMTGELATGGTFVQGLPPRKDGDCLFLAITVGKD